MSTGNVNRPTKNERRQQAREQTKAAREQQQKKEKRNRLFLQGGIVAAIVAIAVVVTLVIVQSAKPEGPGPLNMASGGAVFEADFQVAATPARAASEEPIPTTVNRDKLPLDIVIYVDYMCPYCGIFEQTNEALLNDLVGSGQATVELQILTMLNEQSLGTNYSTRAANAFGCVVNYSPEHAWKFHSALLSAEVQPAEATTGLSDEQLLAQIEKAGADVKGEITKCVENQTFAKFMNAASDRAATGPIPNIAEGSELASVRSTPTVIVNGVPVPSENLMNATTFRDYVYKVLAEYDSSAQ